ncbi:unnamed protein product [Closterium sp. NIES-53]
MASLRLLTFDPEGRPIAFDTWHDDLQLYLLSDLKDSVSLFDHMSGAAPAPPATADVSNRSQLLSRDATARLAIHNHLPTTECAHFGEHRTAQALYDVVVARYSSPATADIGRLLLPYLFPELSAFATVADLVTHLRTSDARYRVAVLAEFLPTNQPPMFITLYVIVTRLPDSLHSVRDHFLTLDPTSLTVDLLEQHLLAAETSAVAVDVSVPDDVGAASTSAKRRNSKGKGGRGSGGGSGGGGGGSGNSSGGSGRGGGGSGGGGGGGTGGGSGGSGSSGGGSGGSGGSGGGGTGGGRSGPRRGGPSGGRGQQQQRRSETQTPQQLREWLVQRGTGEGSETCPYVIRTGGRAGQTCGRFHTEGHCFACLDDAWRAEFGDDVERPRWAQLLQLGVAIFDLDYDVIISLPCMLSLLVLRVNVTGACHLTQADPSGGPDVARSSIVLPCSAVPSDSLSGLHLPSFSTNLVSTAALQDAMVTTTTPEGQRVSICTCTRTGRHLATFTRRPGSSLYTLATEPPQVAASSQVSASGQVAASCSCRLLSHQTLLWHHRLGHPSLPRLRGMHSRLLGRACYFLLVVDDYMRYTTVFPLQSNGEVSDVLIPWIRTVRLQLRERFGQDLPVLRLHSDRGGKFSSDLLRDFCRGEGITQSFTLSDSPQQNGIAERRIGLVIEVARTSMIHAAAPHFLWSFAVRYAAHQLNLWPRVSLPETSPTVRWTGKVGDASMFRVWGSRAFVRDTSADKLSAHAILCVFVGFLLHTLGWQFYHPTSRRVLPSQDVTFDESVPFYRLFPYRSAPPPPSPLFLAPGPPPVDPLLPQGPAPSGVSQVDPLPGTAPVQVAIVSGAAPGAGFGDAAFGGAASGGADPGGARSEGAGSGGAEPEGVEPGGAESEGAESGGAEPWGAPSSGGPAAGGARDTGVGGAEVLTAAVRTGGVGCAGAGDPTEPGAAGAVGAGAGVAGVGGPGAGGAGATGAGVEGTGAGGAGAAGAGAVDPGARGAGDTVRPRPYFVPPLQQVLGVLSTGLPPPFLCPLPDQSQPPLQPPSPLLVPSPYTEQSGGLTERREPASRPVLPVRTTRRAPRSCPPPVPGTNTMALRPSSVPLRVPLPNPHESSLPEVPDPESYQARAASPTVARLLATAVTDPFSESATASALVAELLDFAAACRLDYATALIAESVSASPPSVGGECALGTDVLEDRHEDFECLAAAAITGPYSSKWHAAMDAEMASWNSTGIYVDEVPPPGANIVHGMWIFRVKRSPGSPSAFKARYVVRCFSQRQGVDYFQTFSPTPKMTTLRVLLHVAAQRDYELHSLDFSTAFLQGSLHEEIWLRRPPDFTGSFPAGTQWSLCRPVYGLRQAPREWHDTLRTTLAALEFAPSTADPSLFLRTDTSLPLFYVLVYVDDLVFATADTEALTLVKSELQKRHTCTDLGELRSYLGVQITRDRARRTITLTQSHMVHQSVEPSGPYTELVGCLITSGMGLVLGGRGPVVLIGHADASWVDDSATQRSSQGYTFSLGSGSVSWRSTRSSSILSSNCEDEIYARAMAVQELPWLTYLLTDLGEQPRSPPVLTKHIALRYFLARDLLCLAYVATRANTADVFTKALPRACFAFLDWSCDHLFSPTLPIGCSGEGRAWATRAAGWQLRQRACRAARGLQGRAARKLQGRAARELQGRVARKLQGRATRGLQGRAARWLQGRAVRGLQGRGGARAAGQSGAQAAGQGRAEREQGSVSESQPLDHWDKRACLVAACGSRARQQAGSATGRAEHVGPRRKGSVRNAVRAGHTAYREQIQFDRGGGRGDQQTATSSPLLQLYLHSSPPVASALLSSSPFSSFRCTSSPHLQPPLLSSPHLQPPPPLSSPPAASSSLLTSSRLLLSPLLQPPLLCSPPVHHQLPPPIQQLVFITSILRPPV